MIVVSRNAQHQLVLDEITKARLCSVLRRHGVLRASVFGSVARGEATDTSDLDVLVEFPVGKSLFDLVQLEFDLADAIGKKVDVVTYGSLHPRLREKVLREQVPLF
jgi:predicted nucleotidyltransferase